ncbi:MAG TPA: sn-glycerol-3-phosphate ABC transporter ATP-binding protein UgpC [Longimicrobiaceae bacterium]|nr:sn-glycerol-3-phosphate ABC transporter ATP-binding protein UgpC [Longimicrobiaceae bacterium]
MSSLSLEGVRKVYDNGFVAVPGLDLEVADGELVVLVGPSGCGKSTTLRMIAGLESITDGRLSIGGRVVNDVPPKDRDIAMVFQSYALYPHMSVFENLAFALKLRKTPKAEIARRVTRAAEILQLGAVLDRRPRQLSGGQRQRVALGRAIVREPQLFLFDEPLSNLDAKLRVEMRREILRLHRRLGATSVYVTHDQTEAMTLGDRIVVMRDGVVQQADTPLNVYARPANRFVAGFIGSPAMNFLPGRVEGALFRSEAGNVTVPLPDAAVRRLGGAGAVVAGIRPEDVGLEDGGEVARGPAGAEFVVDVVEPMGGESHVYARAGEHEVVARTASRALPRPGQPVRLSFPAERLHFFDASTGATLCNPGGDPRG